MMDTPMADNGGETPTVAPQKLWLVGSVGQEAILNQLATATNPKKVIQAFQNENGLNGTQLLQ